MTSSKFYLDREAGYVFEGAVLTAISSLANESAPDMNAAISGLVGVLSRLLAGIPSNGTRTALRDAINTALTEWIDDSIDQEAQERVRVETRKSN